MHLAGQDKALVLNKTNAKAIAALYGKKVSAWTGKRIVLVPAMVDFKGDTVEAIRVKAPALKKSTAPIRSQAVPLSSVPRNIAVKATALRSSTRM